MAMNWSKPIFTKEQIKSNKLDVAKAHSEIKRINTRLDAIYNKFGKDSSAYKDAIKNINTEAFAPYLNISAEGKVRLKNSNKLLTSQEGSHLFRIARHTPTLNQLKQKLPFEAKDEPIDNLIQDINEQIDRETEISSEIGGIMSDALNYLTDTEYDALKNEMYGAADANGKRERISYDKWQEIKEKYNKGTLFPSLEEVYDEYLPPEY